MDGNLQKYMAFVKTVELGSFTRAAEALQYTQSSVSKMIADLEREWNMTLLQRSRAGVELTSEGLSILPYARKLVEDYRRLQEYAADLGGLQTGMIRIGTFSSVATHWLPNIIAAFQRDYPGIQYELLLGDYGEIEQWIAEGRVDCGFLRLPATSGFETIPLERDELAVILPQRHPLTDQETVEPSDLNGIPFMLLEHGGRTDVSDLLARYDLHPDVRFITWDDYAIMAMVERGLGAAILPKLILRRIPYQLEIRSLSVPAYRDIGLALRSRKTAPAAVKRFLEYLEYRNA